MATNTQNREIFRLVSRGDLAPEAKTPARPQARHREPSVWRELLYLALKIALIAAVFTGICTFVYGFQRSADPDMSPMVKGGDLVMFYRLDKGYAAGDLLIVEYQGERQIRRVVAVEGDTVDVTENGLVINGALQQEPDIYQQTRRYERAVSFPLTVEAGQVFVLGDARDNATDSRVYGPIDAGKTLGTVITIIRWRNL
ncbi:MAG: signal peptidase I [Defluviitaleaceae bacterium]|nr:signal peptidase I [Defluviitaleaceae bacterium]